MGISSRITIFYSILLISTLSFSGILYQKIYAEIMLKKVSSVSMQTLHSVSSNISSLLYTVNNYSKMILSNPSVQSALESANGYEDVENQRRVVEFMESVMSSAAEITSLYIVDNMGNRFYRDKLPNHFQYFNPDKESEWWKKALENRGSSFIELNGGDAFSERARDTFITSIRVINDLTTQLPIGAVLINVSEDLFIKAYSEIAKNYEMGIIILDEKNRTVLSSSNEIEKLVRGFLLRTEKTDSFSRLIKEDNMLYSGMTLENYNWKVISAIPYGEVKRESRIFMIVTFLIILIISLLILTGSVFIAGMISKPINILVGSMKNINSGSLEEVHFETSIHEFIRLRDGYNYMTGEIKSLVERAIEEEKIKRRAEMNILQAQIKPHFLYNTFDSISSLALMGRNDDVYKMMSALGRFYRVSLSKGKEIISLEEEIDTVRSYLEILKVRYSDIFKVEYSLDRTLAKQKIVKLVLQPFVENALYHGIKPKDEPGLIELKTWTEGKMVKILIRDDGVGMTDQDLDNMNDPDGFGIRGTVERLKLYYGNDDVVSITSEKLKGTSVLLTIPFDREDL